MRKRHARGDAGIERARAAMGGEGLSEQPAVPARLHQTRKQLWVGLMLARSPE